MLPAVEELEGNVGSTPMPLEPAVAPVDSEDELCDRSESEDDVAAVQQEGPGGGSKVGGHFEFEPKEKLEAELAQSRPLHKIADLRSKLVYGVFRCRTGSDFKGRRCRGEVLIERGPRSLLGCRVHVIGTLNRNRAWHFDQCWARISLAKVGQGQGATESSPWCAAAREKTSLYARVVRAEASSTPRQKLVICLRSKFVRSRASMTFRAINGKFPLITVPWEPTEDPPGLFDLHVVEVLEWKEALPRGRYVQTMQMKAGDVSILRAVQVSLNFCDWENPLCREGGAEDLPSVASECSALVDAADRRDLRGSDHQAISIEYPGRPASFAFSLSGQGRWLDVHVVDVNSFLDQRFMGALEDQTRRRAVGAWFLDYLDRPIKACLPLLPPEVEDNLSFRAGQDRQTVTFRFPVSTKSGAVDIDAGQHFDSVVRCHSLLTYEEAEQLLGSPDSSPASATLQALLKAVLKLEGQAVEEAWSCLFHHLEPNFLQGGEKLGGCVVSGQIVAGISYIVNHYAGRELLKAQVWSEILRGNAAKKPVMPLHTRASQDPVARRAASQLMLQCGRKLADDEADVSVKDVVKALRGVLGQRDLSDRQKQCLQSAFLRQLGYSIPTAGYHVTSSASGPQQAGSAHSQGGGSLFVDTPVFHVMNPLRRYLDLLGLRVLKVASGWKPQQRHMFLLPDQLKEVVTRTNARYEACHFAQGIFRQISIISALEPAGWKIKDAVISVVNPGSFQVLVPVGAKVGVSLQLPVSALRSASCTAEFFPESCSLAMTCWQAEELAAHQGARAQWTIAPWGRSKLACVVSRNFTHPETYHAAASAVIPSSVVFSAQVEGSSSQVRLSLGVGHRMFPEVFSTWPDLEKWHLVERDVCAYAQVWHSIRLCQTHAAAAASPVYTPTLPARIEWFKANGGSRELCRCSIFQQPAAYRDRMITPGDVAIISCSSRKGEGVYYGTISSVRAAEKQVKTRLCKVAQCKDPKCSFAHDEEELRGARIYAEVELSDISVKAKSAQMALLNSLGPSDFTVQFISVPLADRRSLEQVEKLPRYASAGVVSPLLSHLVRAREPRHKRELQESRPLATIEQVERALTIQCFHMLDLGLNSRQLDGIKISLQSPFSVVQGPPGTGKTTFLVHLAVALLNLEVDPTLECWSQVRGRRRAESGQAQRVGRILICTPSNHAADEVLARIVSRTDIPHCFVTRIYSRSIEAAHGSRYKAGLHIDARGDYHIRPDLEEHALHVKTRCRKDIRPLHYKLSADGQGAQAQQRNFDATYEGEETAVLRESRIVITTCTSACSHSALVKGPEKRERFATVIVDEAAQGTELDIVMPALMADQRVVLVGDHKQLGPVVTESNLCRAFLGALETSMLERLYRTPELLPANTMLDRQYRMHSSIRSFPSKQFYGSKLEDDESIGSRHMHPSIWPVRGDHAVFVDCQHPHSLGAVMDVGRGRSRTATLLENNTSMKNDGEARLVAVACQRLLRKRVCRATDLAVITPYRAQKEEILEQLASLCGAEARSIAVGTVYALQGSERECIVISFVRSVAEGLALCQNAHATKPTDVVVAPETKDEALRQICESHLGIVSNSKLLNVSLTRAKQGLIMIGNMTVLSEGSQDFLDLRQHVQKRRCLLTEDEFLNLESVR